jgi:hypothetical protein
MLRPRHLGIAMLVPALALAGCSAASDDETASSPTQAPQTVESCDELPMRIADAVQAYVDSFADVEPESVDSLARTGLDDFRSETEDLRSLGEQLGCDPEAVAAGLRDELTRVTGGTPVQDAVLATFLADPLGTVDPSDPAPVDVEVSSTNGLVTAVAVAGSGSTIRLTPGTYVLGEPLVVLRPLRLVGAGRVDTVLRSIAPGAAVLVDADGDVALESLTVEHDGPSAASVIVVTGGGYEFRDLRVSGAVTTDSGAGGFGVILRPSTPPLRQTGTTATMSDVDVVDNAGGGVFVAGDSVPRISQATITDSQGCGLCFVESAGADASSITIVDVDVGVRVDDDAGPTISGLTVRGAQAGVAATGSGTPRITDAALAGNRIAVEVVDSAAPTLSDVTIRRSTNLGLRLADQARAMLSDVTIAGGTPVGMAAVDDARLDVDGMTIRTQGEASAVVASSATLSGEGLDVSSARIGLQADATSTLALSDVTGSGEEAAALIGGESSGSLGMTCTGSSPIVLTERTSVSVATDPSCTVLDRRAR